MADIQIRPFDYDRDLVHVKRIWREVGWVDDDDGEKQLDHFFSVGNTMVGTIDDVPESSVHISPGTMRLLETDLSLCAVSAVTTSRIARGLQFAQRLTAAQLQRGAKGGAAVAALGMFDQGFYDKLGFGTGSYDHQFSFDPASLKVGGSDSDKRTPLRTPVRLNHDHYPDMHRVLVRRPLHHGSVVLHREEQFRAELGFSNKSFGLGYYDNEQLTHFVWMEPKGEQGPYTISWAGYQSVEQLLELLVLLKSLGDQVYSVRMIEPPEIQLQALLQRPFRERSQTKGGRHKAFHHSDAWWQLRVLDVAQCVAALQWWGEDLTFAVTLADPICQYFPDDVAEEANWMGIAGDYVVTLADQCSARQSSGDELPRLVCSVNAFSRLIWGIANASSLAATDEFVGPGELLKQLDDGLKVPAPHIGWDF